MKNKGRHSDSLREGDFASQAAQPQAGILSEYWAYLKQNRKWWLAPIVLALLIVGALILLGGTSAAPFIYTLF